MPTGSRLGETGDSFETVVFIFLGCRVSGVFFGLVVYQRFFSIAPKKTLTPVSLFLWHSPCVYVCSFVPGGSFLFLSLSLSAHRLVQSIGNACIGTALVFQMAASASQPPDVSTSTKEMESCSNMSDQFTSLIVLLHVSVS